MILNTRDRINILVAFQTRNGGTFMESYNSRCADDFRCIALNACSLVCGFVGNGFLLFNFTRRIRYIVALPMTIILWYFATSIVRIPQYSA